MADDGKNQPSFLAISGILALITLLGITIFTQEPLKGIRPKSEKVEGVSEKVAARLWQDPFQAVMETKPSGTQHAVIPSEFLDGSIILAVMVPGAPYAEDSEFRLRWRYAVLAGLRRLGYVPVDGEHINYVLCPTVVASNIGMADIIPFERLVKLRKYKKNVLLLWINENSLAEPKTDSTISLKRLDDMLKGIKIAGKDVRIIGPSDSTRLSDLVGEMKDSHVKKTYRIYSSTATVETLYLPLAEKNGEIKYSKDLQTISSSKDWPLITRTIKPDDALIDKLLWELTIRGCLNDNGKLVIISEWDTYYGRHISDTFNNSLYTIRADFLESEFDNPSSVANLRALISRDNYRNVQAPSADEEKSDIEWLNGKLRIVNLYDQIIEKKKKDGERMTWPIKLLKSRTDSFRNKKHSELTAEQSKLIRILNRMLIEDVYEGAPKVSRQLSRYSYLRGIDGMLPGEDQKKNDTGEKKDKKDIQEMLPSGMPEQASGKSQYDYLRRLAEKIYEEDRRLKLNGERGVTAIGILGTDFYDKYLILQAVRQRLPECVYFTTELDARYLQADNNKWTRNLVVASHFGFELEGKESIGKHNDRASTDIQKDVPPFRDSYQTSLFYAVLTAFATELKDFKLNEIDTEPRIYEIGRRKAVELSTDNHRVTSFINVSWWKIVCLLFFGLCLLAFSSLRIQSSIIEGCETISEMARKRRLKWEIILPIYLLLLVGIGYLSHGPAGLFLWKLAGEEPFSFFEGVSVWPTEILRLSVVFLSILFLVRIYTSLAKNQAELRRDYVARACLLEDPPDACVSFRRSIYNLKVTWDLSRYFTTSISGISPNEEVGLCYVWADYMRFGDYRSRILRVLASCALFFAVAFMLMSIFGPPQTPVRGESSRIVDKMILGGAVLSFIFLTFFVVDATRLCSIFIRVLTAFAPQLRKDFFASRLFPAVPEEHKDIFGEWMLVDLVARHTNVIQKFIFYPFIVLIVLFFSRSQFFDNWQTPVHLTAIIALSAVFAWSCAFRLRRAAEGLRIAVMMRLDRALDKEIFTGKNAGTAAGKEALTRMEQIKHVAKEVGDIKVGAFAPLSQHPLVHSALVAFGGIGGTALLQFLDFFNM